MAKKIFINYRREDVPKAARTVRDGLDAAFGRGAVFMDTRDIAAGAAFDEAIRQSLGESAVMVSLIGPRWLELMQQRSSDSDDVLRQEIEYALACGMVIVPVLIDDPASERLAQWPRFKEDLPESIRQFYLRNALRLPIVGGEVDVKRLVDLIDGAVAQRAGRMFAQALLVSIALAGIAFAILLGFSAMKSPVLLPAQLESNAVYLGDHVLDLAQSRSELKLAPHVAELDRIQLRSVASEVFLEAMAVGADVRPTVSMTIGVDLEKGGVTRPQAFEQAQFVEAMTLSYRSRPVFGKRARIEIYGLLSEGWVGSSGRGRKHNDGWVLIGAAPLESVQSLFALTRHVTIVPNDGRFRSFRVVARHRAVEVSGVRIGFDGKPPVQVAGAASLTSGGSLTPEVPGEGSGIVTAVEIDYRTGRVPSDSRQHQAAIEVWGHY